MEQEMKYAISGKEIADQIWKDDIITEYGDEATRESLVMKAVYFDTENRDLANHNMTIRVRGEGDHKFATLKWGGCSKNGFHERNEINVPVNDDSFIAPVPELFKGSEDGETLIGLLEGKPLINLMEMSFLRRRIRLNYMDSLIELAIDYGEIITDNGSAPILELELELYTGNIESIKKLGEEFAGKYSLTPEDRSKFSRGFALIK